MAYAPDLTRLLTPGARYADKHDEYLIEPHPVGDVTFPTGEVVGCDPLTADDAEPFTVGVAPGAYPLRAWVAVLYRDGAEQQRRVAALQLVICDEPAVRWEPALVAGNDPSVLGENEFFGYGVDAGTGTLADVTAVRALAGWEYERVEDVYIPAGIPLAPVPGVAGAVTDEPTGANVILVSSGWGDGAYPTFVGYAAPGEVSSFVTDFMVVPAG
jgi:hypothetical protein